MYKLTQEQQARTQTEDRYINAFISYLNRRDRYLYLRKAGGRAQPTVDVDSAEKLFEWRLLVIPVLQQQC